MRDALIGRTVSGRYRLISRLGAGGMSSVYLARHVLIDRLVAVKTLRRDLAQDPIQRDRFIREARAVNRINHENIVEISDYGETDDGLVYLVMEYVPGDPLLDALASGPMPAKRALHIVEQIGAALGRAHQMGVVHRDLKPENLLLVRTGGGDFVKVLDFGIAKIMDAPSLTGSQQIFGTPGYIAPEYIQSTDIDGRADLYSLGVILYELVTCALPFDYEYPGDLLVKHVTESPIPPSERQPGLHPALERLVLRCLEKDPNQRFRDAYHFLELLRDTRERLGGDDSWGAMNEPGELTQLSVPTPAAVDEMLERPARDTIVQDRGEVLEDVDIPVPPPLLPSEHPDAPAPEDQGLVGVRRWRARFDALSAAVLELDVTALPTVHDALSFARITLENLEASVAKTEERQRAIDGLGERARDFRTTLGRAIDQLGEKLSHARGELEELARRRRELRLKREGALQKVRSGKGDEGRADALLWELATVEQTLRSQGGTCDAIEQQLSDLQAELQRRNEDVEGRLAALIAKADAEMTRLDNLAHAIREPLDRVEQVVRARWADAP
ncbi:MAG: serine/threonine-protein kinase [Myxococcota bacterium]